MPDQLPTLPTALTGVPASVEVDLASPLTRDEALEITDHIRHATDVMWVLIARAHAGRAWEALGYSSWEKYVVAEFDVSRSRAYQLLDQAKVVQAIAAVAPEGTRVEITEKAARDLKKVLAEVLPEIEKATSGLTGEAAESVTAGVLNEWRIKAQEQSGNGISGGVPGSSDSSDPTNGGSYGGTGDVDWDELDPFADLPDPSVYTDPNDAYISSRPLPGTSPVADLGGVPNVDPALVKRNVQACYDLYASLSVLAVMPSVSDVIATITAERRPYVSEHLGGAMAWLARFEQEWAQQPWNQPDSQGQS